MRPLRALGGWAGFGLAFGVLLALGATRPAGAPAAQAPVPEPRRALPVPPAPVPAMAGAAAVPAATRTARRRVLPALLRAVATLATWSALGAGLGLLLALTAPLAVGMRPLVVVSGSMDPVLRVGDAIVVQRIAPRDAHVGDVVTFKAPGSGRVTTHRVRAVRPQAGGRYAFATKGDANNAVERWTLRADGQTSRAVYRVPYVGHGLLWIATPLGWLLLVGLPLLALGAQEVARIWRTDEEQPDVLATG